MARNVVAEVCPCCGSLEVRATEPRWFRVEWDRRDAVDPRAVDVVEFVCRDCGAAWD